MHVPDLSVSVLSLLQWYQASIWKLDINIFYESSMRIFVGYAYTGMLLVLGSVACEKNKTKKMYDF
jgi:hypothetical protein